MRHQQVILACPEMLGGLACRHYKYCCGHLQDLPQSHKQRIIEMRMLPSLYHRTMTLKLAQQHQIKTAVLKENSATSCGRNFIYDGRFSATKLQVQVLPRHFYCNMASKL